jgi:hypothetical protein
MPDELADFFRCVETSNGWTFQVATVVWEGHTPDLEWTTFRRWKTAPDEARLQKARAEARTRPRFFRTCTMCHRLNNAGLMHNHHTCQSCAERHLGVVY